MPDTKQLRLKLDLLKETLSRLGDNLVSFPCPPEYQQVYRTLIASYNDLLDRLKRAEDALALGTTKSLPSRISTVERYLSGLTFYWNALERNVGFVRLQHRLIEGLAYQTGEWAEALGRNFIIDLVNVGHETLVGAGIKDLKHRVDLYNIPAFYRESLLIAPILAHELGHNLTSYLWSEFFDEFDSEIQPMKQDIEAAIKVKTQGTRRQREEATLKMFIEQWNNWKQEIACDLIALRLLGPTYIVAFMLLSTGNSTPNRAFPSHPSDNSRLNLMLNIYVRENTKHQTEINGLRELWQGYEQLTQPLQESDTTQKLLQLCGDSIIRACDRINLSRYDYARYRQLPLKASDLEQYSIPDLLNLAVKTFLGDPASFLLFQKQVIALITREDYRIQHHQ
jgi:hypothetical protein